MPQVVLLYLIVVFFFFFKQKTAYEMLRSLVGSEMCIRDRYQRRVRGTLTVSTMASTLRFITKPMSRTLCTTAEQATTAAKDSAPNLGPETYSKALSMLHWLAAPAMIGCIGTVLKCQQVPKEEKGEWMFRHKSLGLLTGLLVAPRLVVKLTSVAPRALPGSHAIEEIGAKVCVL
eukprot:TRINITY_DN10096_c0_g2_i12.p2 TRINITY_DN10096_c0_g2~~TRINITY_DN10096_c0_g2_i12.p2  ORF type:complete len:175 (-),score=61.06 TRINITY_DN10096_c0_g2_i12:781-1305(-)